MSWSAAVYKQVQQTVGQAWTSVHRARLQTIADPGTRIVRGISAGLGRIPAAFGPASQDVRVLGRYMGGAFVPSQWPNPNLNPGGVALRPVWGPSNFPIGGRYGYYGLQLALTAGAFVVAPESDVSEAAGYAASASARGSEVGAAVGDAASAFARGADEIPAGAYGIASRGGQAIARGSSYLGRARAAAVDVGSSAWSSVPKIVRYAVPVVGYGTLALLGANYFYATATNVGRGAYNLFNPGSGLPATGLPGLAPPTGGGGSVGPGGVSGGNGGTGGSTSSGFDPTQLLSSPVVLLGLGILAIFLLTRSKGK